MLEVYDFNPNSIDLSSGLIGVFQKCEFERAVESFIHYLRINNKRFSSEFNLGDFAVCGFLEKIDDYPRTFPDDVNMILDYFTRVGYFAMNQEGKYIITDKFMLKLKPFVRN